jgi:hypothetical protein
MILSREGERNGDGVEHCEAVEERARPSAALAASDALGKLDLGCIAAQGIFSCDENGCHVLAPQGKLATAFLFELIARLQALATVPMIEVRAYAKWLTK